MDDESQQAQYKEHLDLSELLLGIKEGRFFQGRLNVSRLTLDEATVNVSGLNQELLIQSLEHQNRAINADIVAVEILPKAHWIKNYKDIPLDKWLDEDAPAVVPPEVAAAQELELAAPQSTTLME